MAKSIAKALWIVFFVGTATGCLFDSGTDSGSAESSSTAPTTPGTFAKVAGVRWVSAAFAKPGECAAGAIEAYDSQNVATMASSNLMVGIGGTALVYSDAACSRAVVAATIPAGASRVAVYVRGDRTKTGLSLQPAGLPPVTTVVDVAQVIQISSGSYHTCAVVSDGTARCWGQNDAGQLGDGSTTTSSVPVVVRLASGAPMSDIRQIAVTARSTCARLGGGNIYCWGQGASGQLGNGLTTDSITPARVMLDGSTPLAGALDLSGSRLGSHYCAVHVSGTSQKVKCWGSNGNGRLGNNSTTTPAFPVEICNYDATSAPSCPVLPTVATQVAVGNDHSCAMFSDKSVYCWGTGGNGQLGTNTTSDRAYPAKVMNATTPTYIANAVQIAAGPQTSCAVVDESGVRKLLCWGYGWRAGDSALTDRRYAQYVRDAASNPVTGVVDVSLGSASCLTNSSKQTLCWGPNQQGMFLFRESLGLGTPEDTGFNDARSVSVGLAHLCFILESTREVKCVGGNGTGQLGASTLVPWRITALADTASYAQVSLGSSFSCGVTGDASKSVKCWGWNRDGRAGLPKTSTLSGSTDVPTATGLTGVEEVRVGGAHACARKTDGSVWCWGSSSNGRLGNNSQTAASATPVQVGRSPHPTALGIDGNSQIVLVGDFPSFDGRSNTRGVVRLTTAGAWDSTFASVGNGFDGLPWSLAIQSDNKVVIGGDFSTYGTTSVGNIVRLATDGSLDSTLAQGTGFNGPVLAVALDSSGKILVAGDFTSYNGTACNRVARLTSTGALDGTWTCPTVDGIVNTLAVQSADGKILIGGTFDNVNSTSRSKIARLATTGALDATFDVGTLTFSSLPNVFVSRIVVQSDGKILAAGEFDTVTKSATATSRRRLVRLGSTGDLDTTFMSSTSGLSAGFDGPVQSVALQSDGKVVVTGEFGSYSYNGTSTSRTRILRLDAAGAVDTAYSSSLNTSAAASIAVQPSDGKVVLAGPFTTVTTTARNRIARLGTDGSLEATTTFNPGTGFGNTTAYSNLLASSLQVGDSFACALSGSRTWCWGAGANGRLGTGGTFDSSLAIPTRGANGVGALRGVAQWGAGTGFTCALLNGGTVQCWGIGNTGQLGSGFSPGSGIFPEPVRSRSSTSPLATAQSIAVGVDHVCALTSETTAPIQCWGSNSYGQLGDQTGSARNLPVLAIQYPSGPAFTGAVELALSSQTTCARLSSGAVWCWGSNLTGRLGLGYMTLSEKIPQPSSLTNATSLGAGSTAINMFARVGNQVQIWGSSDSGLLGDGAFVRSPILVDQLF